jgi:Cu-Zn family superoxide dismutase
MQFIHCTYRPVKAFFIACLIGLMALMSALFPSAALADEEADLAEAVILGTEDSSSLMGDARFIDTEDGLDIRVGLAGAPAGMHGFHIHENGSCAEAGQAAGGHFNPDGVKHGKLIEDGFDNAHAGDLGNISMTPTGIGVLQVTVPGLTLTEGKYAIADRALIVHAQEDDYGQPTGHAGARIGCGVINVVEEPAARDLTPLDATP